MPRDRRLDIIYMDNHLMVCLNPTATYFKTRILQTYFGESVS